MIPKSGTRFSDKIMRKSFAAGFSLPIGAVPDIRWHAPRGRRRRFAAIAQLVEHVIRNDGVGGSSPSCGTTLQQIDIDEAGADAIRLHDASFRLTCRRALGREDFSNSREPGRRVRDASPRNGCVCDLDYLTLGRRKT